MTGWEMLELILKGIIIGVGGTILMDLWAICLHLIFKQPPANWALVGRWFYHLPKGKLFHNNIAEAKPYSHELALGWFFHYIIGALYGVILALLGGAIWFQYPNFITAWIVGLVTVGAGWFILQPGLGLGWAASKTANPRRVRMMNIAAHTVFALGMYFTALILP